MTSVEGRPISERPALRPTVTLRPLTMNDWAAVRRWMADPAVIGFTVVVPGPEYGPVEPYSAAAADEYLALLVKDPDRLSFAIEFGGAHVGNIGLKAFDWRRLTVECFVEIGEHSARRRGIGAEAMGKLLDIAFVDKRLRSVHLGVFDFNEPARALYRKLGFVEDGSAGTHWVDGRFHNVVAMVIDAPTWLRRRHAV